MLNRNDYYKDFFMDDDEHKPIEIDYQGPPHRTFNHLDRLYNEKNVLVMEDILSSLTFYSRVFQDILDIFKYGFEKEEIRKRTIRIKFKREDKKVYKMQLRHVLSNLILWKCFISLDKVELLDESYIFDFTKFNINKLMTYINEKLIPINDLGFAESNAMVDDICHSIICISHAFCLLMGLSVSIYDIYQLEKRNPEFTEIINAPIDPNLNTNEVEDLLNERTSQLIDLIKNDKGNNDFKPVFESGNILKPAQFKEFILKIGYKADINGNTIPNLINGSFLMDGLTTPSEVFINSISGRKAMMLSKLSMGKPGAFSKKLCQASTSASYLRQDNEVCDSKGSLSYFIPDENFLLLLHGRYYYTVRGQMLQLDAKKDTHLIGKHVRFRSPITCNSKEGICRCCYGHLFDINKDLYSVGALAALKLSEPIGQSILSAKHSQETKSDELNFSEGFNNVFETASSEITIRDDADMDVQLFIDLKDVQIEEFDDTIFYFVHNFNVVTENGELAFIAEELNGAKLYLSDELVKVYKDKLKKKDTLIDLELFEDTPLFTIEVKNKELTESLKIFERVLNSKERKGTSDIDELAQTFAANLLDLGIKYDLVHAEAVLRSIIRKKSNILEYPDFDIGADSRDIQIIKLNDSLFYNPSALVSMSYGYLRRQLIGTELYEKNAISHLDPLFVPTLAKYLDQ